MRGGNNLVFYIVLIFSIFLVSCSPEQEGPEAGLSPNHVNWAEVPAGYNPQIEELQYSITNVSFIDLDLMGFNRDVRVIHSQKVPFGTAQIRLYKVWSGYPSWGSVVASISRSSLMVRLQGRHSCEIRVVNSVIQELEGGCIVRAEVVLPLWADIRVINAGREINPR